jgi:OTT_1508-like deaminase
LEVNADEDGVDGGKFEGGLVDIEQEIPEDVDDCESLDSEEMKKSPIYRFLRKLNRYAVACRIIVSELVQLVRLGVGLHITVAEVPVSATTSTPMNENEYPSFEQFLQERVRTGAKLDSSKINRLRDTWTRSWESNNLFLHAEMQIASFYAHNPDLCPIQGFIGVSKKCCWCCDFVLKLVAYVYL